MHPWRCLKGANSTFVFCVLYQRGDCGVPRELSNVQRSVTVIRLEISVTSRWKKQLRDDSIPIVGRDLERGGHILLLTSMLQRASLSCFVTDA